MQAERLFDQGYVKEALQAVNDLEKTGDYSAQDRISCGLLRSNILFELGQFEEGFKLAEQICRESQELGNYLQSVDALISVAKGYISMLNLDDCEKALSRAEILLDRITEKSLTEVQLRKVKLYSLKGMTYSLKGDLEEAIVYHKKSLELGARLGDKKTLVFSLMCNARHYFLAGDLDQALAYSRRCLVLSRSYRKRDVFLIINQLGLIYARKGELGSALKYYEQSLAIAEDLNNKAYIMVVLNNASMVYLEKGELKQALMYLERNLEIAEDIGGDPSYALDNLFIISIKMGAPEQAQLYLNQLQEINEKMGGKSIDVCCRVNEAILLKTSARTLNRAKAEELLRGIVDEDVIMMVLTIRAFIHLCDLLFTEFRMIKDVEVLDDVQTLVTRLFEIAEKQHSYSLMAEANLLRAKIELLSLNLKEARRFLTQAQRLADEHGLHLLARKISGEHDKLLDELNTWEKLKREGIPLAERIKLSGINEQMESMVQKRVKGPPILETEQSINITVFSNTGYMAFSYRFTADSTFDEKIIGNFISMSGQMGTESLDRLRFGNFTVLLNALGSFSICYVFMGQSYSAGQKLNNFTEAVKENKSIIEVLNKAIRTGQQIKLSDNPDLEELITNSFMADPSKFQLPFQAYKGDEPFIFVSYAHSDKLQVYPIMDYLNKSDFNIWYDEGISVSEDWENQ